MKKFTDFINTHPIIRTFILLCIVMVIMMFLLMWCLTLYTRHGEKQIVPNVCGLQVESAALLLEGKGLRYEVVDSVYSKEVEKGCVVEQDPAAGSMVKEERNIYLIINATLDRMVALPNVVDISIRQATTILSASGFKVERVTYKPSEYKDLVLGVYMRGRQVHPDEMIKAESSLELYVGSGNTEAQKDSLSNSGDNIIKESLEEDIAF